MDSSDTPQFEIEGDEGRTSEIEVQTFDVYSKTINKKEVYPGAYYALGILTFINLANYMDRYIPSANKDLIKADLGLSDIETSLPVTAFIVVYMLVSPIFGILADRKTISRPLLIALGVILWSLATAAGFFAIDFWTFIFARTLVGVGEAAYATITPALLSDFFPPDKRNRALTIFYIAIPVGAAIGFGLGGVLGNSLGWRYAFLICGIPGVLLSLLILKVKDPGRGIFDHPSSHVTPHWKQEIKSLFKNKVYMTCVCGSILCTFATGGIADWIPTYLKRVDEIPIDQAGLIAGGTTVIGGLVGTLSGGIIAEKLKGKTRQPYFAVASVALVPATIGAVFIIIVRSSWAVSLLLVATQVCLWSYSGPMNTVIANSVEPNVRARAFAVQILMIHLLGDAISPSIIGGISDATDSLIVAAIPIPIAMGLASLVWAFGWRILNEPPSITLIDLDPVGEQEHLEENDELLDEVLSSRFS